MALSVRELLLIMRVRDEASRTLNNFSRNLRASGAATEAEMARLAKSQSLHNLGSGLIAAGVGVAAVGAAGILALKSWADAAIEYNREAALTLTQVDQTGVSLQQIGKIGLDVAKQVAVPFDEIQMGLYDIFSSMDVTVSESKVLLTQFSKAAVAGQVSLQDAGRATIGILNAYKLGAQGVNRVNDVMFQLVRKGVGTYGQFATTIGRAVPSAVRAGQSIETLGGMMAYLTRNGLSAANAAASSARALDALSNPKAIKAMENMGISVKNAKGEMLPLIDIIQNLHDKLAGLTTPDRAKVIQSIFKGAGGTIQARRFLDIAIKDPTALRKLIGDMNDASGQLEKAYNTMKQTPAMQIQLLQNQFKALEVELGQAFVPILMDIVGWVSKVVQWFNNLSPAAKDWLVKITLISSAMMILLGVATAIVGVFLLLAAAGMAVGIGFGTVLAIVGGIALAIPILIGIVVLIIAKWDWFKSKAIEIWSNVVNYILSVWQNIGPPIMKIINSIINWFYNQWIGLRNWWIALWPDVQQAVSNVWTAIVTVIQVAVGIISAFWDRFGGWILSAVQNVWTTVSGVIGGAMNIIMGIIQFVMGLISGHWENAWNGLKKAFAGILQIILNIAFGFASGLLNVMVQAMGWVPGLGDKLKAAQSAFEDFRTRTTTSLAQWASDLNATGYNAGASFANGVNQGLAGGGAATQAAYMQHFGTKPGSGTVISTAKIALKKISPLSASASTAASNALVKAAGGSPSSAKSSSTVKKTAAQLAADAWSALQDTINFQNQMGQKSDQQTIVALQGLLRKPGATLADQRSVMLQIKQLQDGIEQAKAAAAAKLASDWQNVQKSVNSLVGDYSGSSIVDKFNTLFDNVSQVMTDKNFSKGQAQGIIGFITNIKNQLVASADQLDTIVSKLSSAKDALKTISDEASSFQKSVSSGIMGASLVSGEPAADSVAFNKMLQDRIKATQDFINNMRSLISKGLSQDLVKDLLAQGAASGGPMAAFLNGASASDLAALNNAQDQLTAMSKDFGTEMYNIYYKNGVDMAQGLVDGLSAQQTNLQNMMDTVASGMVGTIKNLLGIASPSRVFHDIGKMTMLGLSQGINKHSDMVMSSIGGVAGSMVVAASSPGVAGAQGKQVIQHFEINTQEIDPIKHAADLGWELARRVV